jgi:hypothetical protein
MTVNFSQEQVNAEGFRRYPFVARPFWPSCFPPACTILAPNQRFSGSYAKRRIDQNPARRQDRSVHFNLNAQILAN